MRKITKLTPEQQSQLAVYRDRWIAQGLSTDRADRQMAEAAFAKLYRAAGEEKPTVIWVPSPLVGGLAAAVLASRSLTVVADRAVESAVDSAVRSAVESAVDSAVESAVHGAVRNTVRNTVHDAVDRAVRNTVRNTVHDAVDRAVDSAVRNTVHGAVRNTVHDAVESAVESAVHDAVRSAVESAVDSAGRSWFGGSLWPGFASWADFMQSVLQVEIGIGSAFVDTCKSTCYWWPLRGFILASERPLGIHRDDLGRLHHESGPSIAWEDGFALYHWHGQGVPAKVITDPASITLASIKAEGNAEVRRVMTERYGIGRYLGESGAQLVDFDRVEVIRGSGKLMPRCLLRDSEGRQYLEGTDGSTDRCYFMPVDPEAQTCRQAHESICGLDETKCVAQS